MWTNPQDSSELPVLTSWVSACENCYFPKEAHGLLLWLFICIIRGQGNHREGPVMWEDTQTRCCPRALRRRRDAPRTDGRLPTHSFTWRSQARPHHAHTELAASWGLWGFMISKPNRLNHPTEQPHSTARMDGQTDTQKCPLPCRSVGQPLGCQAGRCPYRTSWLISHN